LVGRSFGGTFLAELSKKLFENIDDVKSVILSKATGYQPAGKPLICLTSCRLRLRIYPKFLFIRT